MLAILQHPTPERMVTIKHLSMQFGLLQDVKEVKCWITSEQ